MPLFDDFNSIIIEEIDEYLEDVNHEVSSERIQWDIYYNDLIRVLSTSDGLVEDVSADFVEKIIEKYSDLSSGKRHLMRTIVFDACYHFCNVYLSEEYEQEIHDNYNEYLNTFD